MNMSKLMCAGAGGVAEDLSAVLAGGCPGFFKEDDKTFYAASGLLQRAEATTAASERAHLTREALRLMMKARAFLPNSPPVTAFRSSRLRSTKPAVLWIFISLLLTSCKGILCSSHAHQGSWSGAGGSMSMSVGNCCMRYGVLADKGHCSMFPPWPECFQQERLVHFLQS